MECRHDVRAISTRVAEVDGVVALEVDVSTQTVRVEGDVTLEAVRAAIAAAGFPVTE